MMRMRTQQPYTAPGGSFTPACMGIDGTIRPRRPLVT